MRLYMSEDSTNCCVENAAGEVLKWNMTTFGRTKMKEVEDIFAECNGFLQWLGHERSERIWRAYANIENVFLSVNNIRSLTEGVADYVKDIYNEISLNDIDHWIQYYGNVAYPERLLDVHDSDDNQPDKTYLKQDYHGLVILMVATRFMVPIWGQYIYEIKKITHNDFKEYTAMQLLKETELLESEPILRLGRYIVVHLKRDVDLSGAVLSGLATTEVPDWMLSMVVIRRIALGEIDAIEDKGDIIRNVFRFIDNQLNGVDSRFGLIKEKYPDKTETEDERSRAELQRVKQAMTALDKKSFELFSQRPIIVAQKIDPDIPDSLVMGCVSAMRKLELVAFSDEQLVLVQNVLGVQTGLGTVLSPHAIPVIEKQPLLNYLGVTQALLWHWGFSDLALLCSAEPEEIPAGVARPPNTRSRVPEELITILDSYYPLRQNQDSDIPKKSNLAWLSLFQLSKDFENWSWKANVPPILANRHKVEIDISGYIRLPTTLGEQLVRMAIRKESIGETQ